MGQLLSTRSVSERERESYWREAICDAFVQLDYRAAEPATRGGFVGEIRKNTLSTLELSVVNASPQLVRRTPRQIGRSNEDYFLVNIQVGGRCVVSQDGRSAELKAGDFALYDSTRPYDLWYPETFEQVVLMLPRDLLQSQVRTTDRLTATRVSGLKGAGHLMINMIGTLVRDVDELDPTSFDAVSNAVLEILIAGLRTLPAARQKTPSRLAAYHLERIKTYAAQQLANPRLSVESLSDALQLSQTTLYRIFDEQPCSLMQWVWAQRLDRAKRDLADPALRASSITEIALAWGFGGSAHFCRAFKRRYGVGPRDFRLRAAEAGLADVAIPRIAMPRA